MLYPPPNHEPHHFNRTTTTHGVVGASSDVPHPSSAHMQGHSSSPCFVYFSCPELAEVASPEAAKHSAEIASVFRNRGHRRAEKPPTEGAPDSSTGAATGVSEVHRRSTNRSVLALLQPAWATHSSASLELTVDYRIKTRMLPLDKHIRSPATRSSWTILRGSSTRSLEGGDRKRCNRFRRDGRLTKCAMQNSASTEVTALRA